MPSSLRRMQRHLQRNKIAAFLVTSLANVRYLSGFDSSAGCMIVTLRHAILYLDPRYLEAAKQRRMPGVRVCPATEFRRDLRKIRVIRIEGDHVTLAQLRRWQRRYKNTKFVQTSGFIEELRRSKAPKEILMITRACSRTRSILRLIPGYLKTGITERELAWKIEALALRLGADGMAFSTIVGFGENSASPHHHPTDRRLKKGDIVQIDMGVRYGGYCSDFSRVFFTAVPTSDQRRVLWALNQAKRSAEKLITPGADNRSLDREARRVLGLFGFERAFTHALGHGVGLEIHEGMSLSRKAPLKNLLKNEVITIEPGVYFPGKWGMRIEDTIVVR